MQDIISSNPTAQQQSVIQSNTMNMEQQQDTTSSQLLFTATIFSQDMSQSGNAAQQQQVMTLQNPQISNDSSSMIAELNTFMDNQGLNMSQAQTAEQMMAQPSESDDKDSYKGKFSRMHWKTQLP